MFFLTPSQLPRTTAVNGLATGACAHAGVTVAMTAEHTGAMPSISIAVHNPPENTLCVSVSLCLCDRRASVIDEPQALGVNPSTMSKLADSSPIFESGIGVNGTISVAFALASFRSRRTWSVSFCGSPLM